MSSYSNVRIGKLKLKGMPLKKKKRKEIGEMDKRFNNNTQLSEQLNDDEVSIQEGSGRIISSGTTIHGYETKFTRELCAGDALLIQHPQTLVDETRLVTMVLSDVSIAISSPFSSDLVSTTAFRYVSAPKEEESQEIKAQQQKRLRIEREDTAVGDDFAGRGGSTLVVQTRKAGVTGGSNGWQRQQFELKGPQKSRTELLELRSKFKSDRFC
mmetsp:Transcript_20822/g.26966  ORF Transcript_20822/g.26966 Transcript_20822/m.26966 type:complete len:212 (-) Transcript_20822:1827-2462(-)